jgi:hypothetical protein
VIKPHDVVLTFEGFEIIDFVRGNAITDFVEQAEAHLHPERMVLFKDIRKKGLARITLVHRGQPRPEIEDNPRADYVVVLNR